MFERLSSSCTHYVSLSSKSITNLWSRLFITRYYNTLKCLADITPVKNRCNEQINKSDVIESPAKLLPGSSVYLDECDVAMQQMLTADTYVCEQ